MIVVAVNMGAVTGFAGIENMLVGTFFAIEITGMVVTVTHLVTHFADRLSTRGTIGFVISIIHRDNAVISVYNNKGFLMTVDHRGQVYGCIGNLSVHTVSG
jgi:hypothetical protein